MKRQKKTSENGAKRSRFSQQFKKIADNPTVRQLGKTALKKAINYAPQLYNLGASKIKNKTARKILQSDTATNLLNNCYKIRRQIMTTGNGITNIDIGCLFVRVNNKIYKLLRNNKRKRAKYPFAIFNTDRENKPGTCWWSFLDIYPKKRLVIIRQL